MEIRPFDISRMLMGDLPWLFLLEVAFRTSVMYLYALFIIRLMGKRGTGELTPFELAIIIVLGSAAGDPMFYDDVPLLPAMVVLTVVIILHRIFIRMVTYNREAGEKLESGPVLVIEDGLVMVDDLKRQDYSNSDLYALVREEGIDTLGKVWKAYLEKTGSISVMDKEKPVPGLCILPDAKHYNKGDKAEKKALYSCWNCGNTTEVSGRFNECARCDEGEWVESA